MAPLTLLDRLLLLAELFQRDMAREYDGTPLSPARVGVLWNLHHRGPLAQHELATALDVTPRNITGLVDALEQHGYVVRVPHPTDRRARVVELTPSGRAVTERTAREHAELSETLLLAVDPADRAALERGLDAVTATVRELMAEAEASGRAS